MGQVKGHSEMLVCRHKAKLKTKNSQTQRTNIFLKHLTEHNICFANIVLLTLVLTYIAIWITSAVSLMCNLSISVFMLWTFWVTRWLPTFIYPETKAVYLVFLNSVGFLGFFFGGGGGGFFIYIFYSCWTLCHKHSSSINASFYRELHSATVTQDYLFMIWITHWIMFFFCFVFLDLYVRFSHFTKCYLLGSEQQLDLP